MPYWTPAAVLLLVIAAMVVEAQRSIRNEHGLRRQGAFEPPGDVHQIMQVAYPGCFVAMAVESTLRGSATPGWFAVGAAVFVLAKLLKYWAIATLGPRWCFRVLVPPGSPRLEVGPYRWISHPNYLAVVGELAATMMMLAAFFTGAASILGFGTLMAMRMRVEESALRDAVRPRRSPPL